MKILHIVDGIPPAVLGGTGRIVCDLANGQSKSGHQVAILSATTGAARSANGPTGEILLTIPERDARWSHYRCVFSRTREQEVLKHIDAFGPQVVHAHTVSRQCGYRWMASLKPRGIRLVLTCHDVSHVSYGKAWPDRRTAWWQDALRYRWTWNPLRQRMIRRYVGAADCILTVSDSLKTYLTWCGFPPMQTLHNGIDLNAWKPTISQAEARNTLKLPTDLPLFLLAGRLGHDKGSPLVAATLPANTGLLIAGDGFGHFFHPLKQRVWTFPRQSAQQMRVLYTACDAVLVPSKCLDCFPTVCLEAMAMGRPVLATSWGGAKESVQDGVTGWILDPLDEAVWREKMQWCIDHRKELPAIGSAGRRRMEEHFGLPMMLREVEAVYQSVLA